MKTYNNISSDNILVFRKLNYRRREQRLISTDLLDQRINQKMKVYYAEFWSLMVEEMI